MKKKSLFGINVKLALMLVAICGMFASCYEKEELTTEAPSTVKPVYKITGVVSNASTGEPLSGAKVNGATTATRWNLCFRCNRRSLLQFCNTLQ